MANNPLPETVIFPEVVPSENREVDDQDRSKILPAKRKMADDEEILGEEAMLLLQQGRLEIDNFYSSLQSLEEACDEKKGLIRIDDKVKSTFSEITKQQMLLIAAGQKFLFMQKLLKFVDVTCNILKDKGPRIVELENQMLKIHEERARAILERRAANDINEMKDLEAAVAAGMTVFQENRRNLLIEDAKIAIWAAYAAAREWRKLPLQLDELGRDANCEKAMDIKSRAEMLQVPKHNLDLQRLLHVEGKTCYQPVEREVSSDESDSEITNYESNRSLLLQSAEQIFSDVPYEHSEFALVFERFKLWRDQYASEYPHAEMSKIAPDLFSDYVRLELLEWTPLYDGLHFDSMEWFSLLANSGLPQDSDLYLIPELVENHALRILHHHLQFCWDTLSSRQTKCAVSATNLVLKYVPHSSPAVESLIILLRDRLSDAVAKLAIPVWSPVILLVAPNAAQVATCRFGMSVRLMRNICLWNKILAPDVLEKVALDDLLGGKVLPYLRRSALPDAIRICERIVSSMDGIWTGPGVTGGRSPKLQPFVDCVLTHGETLKDRHVAVGLDTARKLAQGLKKILMELNELDYAKGISATFGLDS